MSTTPTPPTSPLPEGRTLSCTACHTRITVVGRFPDDMRCPCGGQYELAEEPDGV